MEAVLGYKPSFWRRAGHAVANEFMHVLPAVLFFTAGFNLIVFSVNLALAAYFIRVSSFLIATGAALIVGKVVLVADKLPFLRRFDTAPLIWPILFKTAVYWALVFVARIIEAFVKYWISYGHPAGFLQYLVDEFSWSRFAFVQIWILVLFLIYTSGVELNALFGQDELYKLMFVRGSTKAKLSRRQRIRTLVHLNRLTQRYTEAELKDAASPAHAALLDNIITLVRDKPRL
jgi:hypothetical protein